MKKEKINRKIFITNFRRTLMSLLFVNVSFGWLNKVTGTISEPTCYAAGPSLEPDPATVIGKVFVLLVPLVIVIGIIILIIRKVKKSKKK